ncbi:MAG: glycosyltransferase family 4 protein [Euryarchaeota archaeon]|nr:glycosyltransferase family 4 protein [Euryarchaeota archaeon]
MAPRLPPYHSGTGTVAVQNARGLAERGLSVELACMREEGTQGGRLDGVPVHRLQAAWRVGNAGRLKGLEAHLDVDVVHLHLPFIFGAGSVIRAARKRRVALVATYHQDLQAQGVRGAAFSAYLRYALPRQLRAMDAIVVPTLDYARQSRVAPWLGNAVEVPHGIDTEFFSPMDGEDARPWPWPATQPTFLFVAALDRAHDFKGLDTLLRALTHPSAGRARLVVVGDGDRRSQFETTARRLGLKARVHFAGELDAQGLRRHYRAATATILPSLHGDIFGMVLVESMACGRPVIATRLPGVRAVVRHDETGILVPPGDADALSRAIVKLVDAGSREMGLRARAEVVERFDRRRTAALLEHVYGDAVERGRRRRGSRG